MTDNDRLKSTMLKIEVKFNGKTTFLSQFIEGKCAGYVEPQRKGLPKGSKIGYPLKKYLATLLRLTNMSLKEIADKFDISHNTMRQWNSESEFKNLFLQHCNEFVDEVLAFSEKVIQNRQVNPLGDARHLSRDVIDALLQKIIYLSMTRGYPYIWTGLAWSYVMKGEQQKKAEDILMKIAATFAINEALDFIRLKKSTDAKKRDVLECLEAGKKILERSVKIGRNNP